MQERIKGAKYQHTLICIDSYEKRVPEGRFYNPYYPNGVYFFGAIDLVKKMEAMMEENQFPQAYSCVRVFTNGLKEEMTPAEINQKIPRGTVATFMIRILFRRNASWQGQITWLEGKKKEEFRSVLEFFSLLDSVVTEEKHL